MAYFPSSPNHDPLDGRDPAISKHHKTLKASRAFEDADAINSFQVPYDDLQRSPAACTGHFRTAFDIGTLTICSRPYHSPKPMAIIQIRNYVKSTGEMETLVSLHVYSEEDSNGK